MISNTVCITYNNPTHERFQNEFENLYKDNFTFYHGYKKDWLEKTMFYQSNPQMFKHEKYGGYFLWKPYCISVALRSFYCEKVLYCDSNLRFLHFPKFEELFNDQMATEGIFLIKHKNYINKDWTKRDAFVLMDADYKEYWGAHQVWSVILGFSESKRRLLDDYLFYCRNPQIVTDMPNMAGQGDNLPGFKEHRWEQSVISILAERYGVKGIWDVDVLDIITKVYDDELYTYKKQIAKKEMKWNT